MTSRALFESVDALLVRHVKGGTPRHQLVVDLAAPKPEHEPAPTQLVD